MPHTTWPETVKVECVRLDTDTLKEVVNVYHVKTPTPGDHTTQADIAAAFQAFEADYIGSLGPSSLQGQYIQVTDVSVAGGATTSIPTTSLTGSGTSGAGGVAALVKLRTGLSGRSNHGRSYQGTLTAGAVNNGKVSSGTISTLQGYFTGLMTALGSVPGGAALCIASKVTGLSPLVTDVLCEILPAYQRRRGAR